MAGNVDANLVHNGDCFRANIGWLRASRKHIKAITSLVAQQTFSHLAPGRIASAKNQDSFLICHERFDAMPKLSPMSFLRGESVKPLLCRSLLRDCSVDSPAGPHF